jgi:hypothetical protein
MKTEIDVRDGEACLEKKVLEASLHYLVGSLVDMGYVLDNVRIDRVTRNETWKSTNESTEVVPVLYFVTRDGSKKLLITKRYEDKEYTAFEYRWTP